jgi:hypothetical protein
MILDDDLHQRPDPDGGKHPPDPLFDDRVGEPGARKPSPTTNSTWREVIAMVSLAMLLVLAILAVHPVPLPNPTVNISAAVRATPEGSPRPAATNSEELAPCADPRYAHEKC